MPPSPRRRAIVTLCRRIPRRRVVVACCLSLLVEEEAALLELHPAARRGDPARLPGLDILLALRTRVGGIDGGDC